MIEQLVPLMGKRVTVLLTAPSSGSHWFGPYELGEITDGSGTTREPAAIQLKAGNGKAYLVNLDHVIAVTEA